MGFEIINSIKKEKGLTNAQIAQMSGVTLSTLDKITAGINTNPKLDTLQAICSVLGCTLNDFADTQNEDSLSPPEKAHIKKYRLLDPYGKEAVDSILNIELHRCEAVPEKAQDDFPDNIIQLTPMKKMKRFLNPVSAGPGSYLFGDGYDEVDVPVAQKGDYIVTVSGDSMEPYIHDGQDLFVSMGAELQEGDVGIFLVEGSTYCKQFVPGYGGFVHLMSLNRDRADKDLYINTKTTRIDSLGKVLLKKRPKIPFDR